MKKFVVSAVTAIGLVLVSIQPAASLPCWNGLRESCTAAPVYDQYDAGLLLFLAN